MSSNKPQGPFDLQMIIGPELRDRSALLVHLAGRGLFEIMSPANNLYLPIDQAFADTLGCARYVRDPLPAYNKGMLQQLHRIETSPDGQAAIQGDMAALERVIGAVQDLQATIKVALTNGDLVLG